MGSKGKSGWIGRIYAIAIIAFTALLASPVSHAEQLSLLINGKAVHLGKLDGVKFNEDNWGAGFQYDFDATADNWIPFVTASGFLDSNNNPSYYAGGGALKRFDLGSAGSGYHVDLGGVAFVMTRQEFNDEKPFFAVLPAMAIGTDQLAVNVSFVPKVDPKTVALFFFQIKVGLGGVR
jgi:hypothetical protein